MNHSDRFLKIVESIMPDIKEISVEDTTLALSSPEVVLVDVREDREWKNGRAAKAIHIGKGVIERDIQSKIPDVSKKIILYCGGGYRSALAAYNLQKMGYTNVLSMAGGYKDWVSKSLPVESD